MFQYVDGGTTRFDKGETLSKLLICEVALKHATRIRALDGARAMISHDGEGKSPESARKNLDGNARQIDARCCEAPRWVCDHQQLDQLRIRCESVFRQALIPMPKLR